MALNGDRSHAGPVAAAVDLMRTNWLTEQEHEEPAPAGIHKNWSASDEGTAVYERSSDKPISPRCARRY